MPKQSSATLLLLQLLIVAVTANAQHPFIPTRQDTLKGAARPARIWWNVLFYNLTIQPDYFSRTIKGENVITYQVVADKHPDSMQIDLQTPLIIDSVVLNWRDLCFKKDGNVWFLMVPRQKKFSVQQVAIYYSGKPKESRPVRYPKIREEPSRRTS